MSFLEWGSYIRQNLSQEQLRKIHQTYISTVPGLHFEMCMIPTRDYFKTHLPFRNYPISMVVP